MRMIKCIHCGKKFSTDAETYIEIDGLKVPRTGFVENAKIYICESCFTDVNGDNKNFK